jgi:protein-S-isoprenylcysteine O-methyltransferase Ste14
VEQVANSGWWRGYRGEWYVVVQGVIFMVTLWSPWACEPASKWPTRYTFIGSAGGILLLMLGFLIAISGVMCLRENLTPLPHPKERGRLIVTGAYRWVRHPVYSGIILSAFGFGLLMQCSLTLCCAALVFLFFEVKTRREEQWLSEKYPEYAVYRKRVKRLIPFIH